jgi:hypothetical protein
MVEGPAKGPRHRTRILVLVVACCLISIECLNTVALLRDFPLEGQCAMQSREGQAPVEYRGWSWRDLGLACTVVHRDGSREASPTNLLVRD